MIHQSLFDYDEAVRAEHGCLLCGVDEAGRGPLAGPVCCAAVILKPETVFDGLNDSKKVNEKNRERLFHEITEQSVAYCVAFIDNRTIDEINILNATMLGMTRAILGLKTTPNHILIDGNRVPGGFDSIDWVVKGDANSASIAAASILAKVSRDSFMKELDTRFPQYGFAAHKGYPTKAHYKAIEAFGLCEYHRRSFLKGRI